MRNPRNNGVVGEAQVEVRLSRIQSNGPDGDYFELEIRDKASSVEFARLKFPLGSASALLSLRSFPAEATLQGLALVGCKRETKTEFVPGSPSYNTRKTDTRIALEPFEVDGWTGYDSDYGNGHCGGEKDGVKGYGVTFVRYVRPDGTVVE